MDANWDKLPSELLLIIANKLSCWEDYIRLAAVSQSWNSILSHEKLLLPPESPLLFLAEQVAEGGAFSCELEPEDEEEDEDEEETEYTTNLLLEQIESYDYRKESVGNTRGLYSLSTRKTYHMELPEASGRVILGTDKGWLLTWGRDSNINLLHPLSRHQIPLAPMHTFTREFDVIGMFFRKVVLSSQVHARKDDDKSMAIPTVMTIYGECGYLGFTRLGDKVWTDVDVSSKPFEDIVYYNGSFYVVNCCGTVFVCDSNDAYNRGIPIGTYPLSLHEVGDYWHRYLVESEFGLLLVLRIRKIRFMKPPKRMTSRYRTIDFRIWKIDLKFSDDCQTPSATFIQVNNLGNKALFIGGASSVMIQSSDYIKPNSIYFTDDLRELYSLFSGGGHDMGIFSMESHTIEPFFQGKSIHPVSPPLWYI